MSSNDYYANVWYYTHWIIIRYIFLIFPFYLLQHGDISTINDVSKLSDVSAVSDESQLANKIAPIEVCI